MVPSQMSMRDCNFTQARLSSHAKCFFPDSIPWHTGLATKCQKYSSKASSRSAHLKIPSSYPPLNVMLSDTTSERAVVSLGRARRALSRRAADGHSPGRLVVAWSPGALAVFIIISSSSVFRDLQTNQLLCIDALN